MSDQENQAVVDPFKPYKGCFESFSSIPQKGRSKDEIYKELSIIAKEENTRWAVPPATAWPAVRKVTKR